MSLNKPSTAPPDSTLLGTALTVAPAAVGCAVGLLLAEKLSSRGRQSAAVTLFGIGVVATLPLAIDYVTKSLNSPTGQRGSRRRLEKIREGAPDEEIIGGEDYFLERPGA